MKKYAILLFAGSIIGLAACGDNKNETTQEQIDSAANARSAAMEAELSAKNDSLINAMAKMKADSAMRADSMAKTSVSSTTTTKTTTVKTTKSNTTTKPASTKSDGTKVTDRPGASDAHINGQIEKPKSVSDRPGATDVHR